MFNSMPAANYQNTVVGTWGTFETPAGAVAYVLTKARLGTTGTDNERRLTSQLRPVREVLNASKLDFNQLLQRDLDDHRVATELLPYLLRPKPIGPAFFPPIMAVLLPFDGKQPVDDFPPAEGSVPVTDEDGLSMLEQRVGSAYRVRTLALEGAPHPSIKLAKLSWNDERAKLVVLDGQHRAMALIAVDRTLNETWGQSGSGERYSHFYQGRVLNLVEEAQKAGKPFDLTRIEVPVLVCWFPTLHGPGSNAHRAARKLFVDVNKEARQPSEARLTLLSDTQLLNVFTRALLNRLRQPDPPLPLYAIEYDNPQRDAALPVRWSVLTNLSLLKNAVQFTIFGPDRYISKLESRFSGRPSWHDMNKRMQLELGVDSLFPAVISEETRTIERSALGNENFPLTQVDVLVSRMSDTWGAAILTVLGKLLPYEAHCQALAILEDEWVTDGAMASLAKEALFVGVGIYWTLRDSDIHWKTTVKQLKDDEKPIPPAPEITKGWAILEEKEKRFAFLRTNEYLGSTDQESQLSASKFFAVANTQACQLGAILAFASLAHYCGWKGTHLAEKAKIVVEAWNAALKGKINKSTDRRMVWTRDVKSSINRIRRLDTPLAVYFRYFWLELLRTKESIAVIGGDVGSSVLEDLTLKARTNYFSYLVDEQKKELKTSNAHLKPEALHEKARGVESYHLRKALKYWFSDDGFDQWLASTMSESQQAVGSPTADADESEGEESSDEAKSEDPLAGLSPD